jgi:hypothetical protein
MAGVRAADGLLGALAVAGSVASLGGLNDDVGAAGDIVKGCLCPDEGDEGVNAGVPIDDWPCPRLNAPRMNFCRGMFGGGVGFTFRVFNATDEVGVGLGGFRLVLIGLLGVDLVT